MLEIILHAEMRDELHPSPSNTTLKMTDEETLIYQQVKDKFSEGVNRQKTGADFVEEIFRRIDEIINEYRQNHTIVCQSGCSYCCHQLICCTSLEMELLTKYIKGRIRNVKTELKKRLRKETIWLNNRMREYSHIFRPGNAVSIGPLYTLYRGRQCLFLGPRKTCLIYPVRPIDCRIAITNRRCGTQESGASTKGIRLFAAQVASDLIMDEEERVKGVQQLAAIATWPLAKEFSSFFS